MALRTGMEVPAAMRPILQSLADQGVLTDENGDLLRDLSKIPFAETMTQGFDRIVKKIEELLEKLGLTKDAINNLPDADVNINYRDNRPPGLGENGGRPDPRRPREPLSVTGATLAAVDTRMVAPGGSLVDTIAEAVKEGIEHAKPPDLFVDGRKLTDVMLRNQRDQLAVYGVR
jgi:hypothetical protein